MENNNRFLGTPLVGAIIGLALLAFLIFLELLPYMNQASGPPPAGGEIPARAKMGALFAALPAWVNIWMHFQDIIIGASLFFVLWRKSAQIYALGVVANHVFLFALMPVIPIEKLDLGLAALSHWLWLIPLYVLIREWPKLDKASGYGTWVTIAIAQLIFSLSFDIPQGAQFLISLFG